jgi:hypothetical protein
MIQKFIDKIIIVLQSFWVDFSSAIYEHVKGNQCYILLRKPNPIMTIW